MILAYTIDCFSKYYVRLMDDSILFMFIDRLCNSLCYHYGSQKSIYRYDVQVKQIKYISLCGHVACSSLYSL